MSKLLIVSDTGRFRGWARSIAESEGFSVLEARDGLAALQVAFEDAPRVIVIDPELSRTNLPPYPGLRADDVRKRLLGEAETRTILVHIPSVARERAYGGPSLDENCTETRRHVADSASLREALSRAMRCASGSGDALRPAGNDRVGATLLG